MPIWFQALIVLAMVWVVARVIKRRVRLFQRFFIPSSIIGGVLLLLIGPQVVGVVPAEMTSFLAILPALLINVVFASLFLGKPIPSPKTIWRSSGSMIAFGSTIAWGMYVLAIVLVLFLLGPLFGVPSVFGTLLELSFSGGHGTAAGFAPMFADFGWSSATDVALGLATFSIIAAIILGLLIINVYNRRSGRILDEASMKVQQNRMIRNGYSLVRVTKMFETNPRDGAFVLALIGAAIGIGWCIQQGIVWAENALLGDTTDMRVFTYLPLFTLAMFGGLIVTLLLKWGKFERLVNAGVVQNFSSIALDLLIITAIGTISLTAIADNVIPFITLAVMGTVWIVFSLFVLAPRIFRKHWFEFGMTDFGQAMGTTATGLLMNRLVDPLNKSGAREAFAYKQLAYEVFMGGGIATALMAALILENGVWTALVIAVVLTLFWLIVGLILGRKTSKRQRKQLKVGGFVVKQ